MNGLLKFPFSYESDSLSFYLSWPISGFMTRSRCLWWSQLSLGNLCFILFTSLHPVPLTLWQFGSLKHRWLQFSSPSKLAKVWEGNAWLGFVYLSKDKLFCLQMIAAWGGYAVPGRHCCGLLCRVILFLLVCLQVMSLWFLQLVRLRIFVTQGSWAPEGAWWRGFRVPMGFHI